jgi:PKD repeat protein
VNVTGENATAPCTITLSNGTGACSLTFNAEGQQRITATYGGDAQFNGSNDNENHRVEPVAPQNTPPTAAFNPPTNCVAGQPCQFNDGSSDSDGNVVGWLWDFGGTGTSDQQNPTFTFGEARTYDVTLTARDDDEATSSVTHAVTVTAPANRAPTPVGDTYPGTAGQPLTADAASGVLVNDSDPDNNPLTVESNTQPAQGGLVTVHQDGSFEYFPGAAAPGTQDTFSYTVTDGSLTASATVTINIQ